MSIGRLPKSSPPGSESVTRPQRPSNGPSTLIEARIRSTSSYGATGVMSPRFVIVIEPSAPNVVDTPIAANRSLMMLTSAMAGTLDSRYTPSASSVAAMSFRTEFLAPGTTTAPCSGTARRMTIRSDSMANKYGPSRPAACPNQDERCRASCRSCASSLVACPAANGRCDSRGRPTPPRPSMPSPGAMTWWERSSLRTTAGQRRFRRVRVRSRPISVRSSRPQRP